jgi:hypothetical protein
MHHGSIARAGALCAILASLCGSAHARAQESLAPAQNPAPAVAPEDEAREATVWLRGGQRITGTLVEASDLRVVLSIGGVRATFARDAVERLDVSPSIDELYRQLRASIEETDVEGILRLAEWLRARKRLAQALAEVNRALMVEPANPRARDLRTVIEQQIRLAAASATGGPEPPAAPVAPDRPEDNEFPLLDERQINLMRVYEVDLANPPRMALAPDLIARLIEAYQGDPLIPTTRAGRDLLFSMRPEQLLDLMFRLRARDLYDQVQVLEHPRSIRLFRDNVHRGWLLSGCASNQCHGGSDAGRLQLATRHPGTNATVYTNLYILDRYRLRDGSPLIDYDQPARSPLIQAGLPRERSTWPHPPVEGWRPVFRTAEDPRIERTVEWIRAMYRPRPDYGIQYVPRKPFTPEEDSSGHPSGER